MATSRALLLKEAAPQLHTSNIDVLAQGQSFLGGALSFLNHSLSVAAAAGSAQAVLASLTKVFFGSSPSYANHSYRGLSEAKQRSSACCCGGSRAGWNGHYSCFSRYGVNF